MRTYEMLMILRPDLSEEEIAETKERMQNIINDSGGVFGKETDGWGKRRLAYSIEDYTEGVYVLWVFEGQPETVAELNRIIKISDRILRHLIIRKEE